MVDNFKNANNAAHNMPVSNVVAVTPHDTNALAFTTRAIYVGVAGDVVCRPADSSSDITIKNAPIGWHPIRVTHIRATNTTATNILAGE